MRKVSIRQLAFNLHKELEDLPLEVTKYGKPYAQIYKTSDTNPMKNAYDRNFPKEENDRT